MASDQSYGVKHDDLTSGAASDRLVTQERLMARIKRRVVKRYIWPTSNKSNHEKGKEVAGGNIKQSLRSY